MVEIDKEKLVESFDLILTELDKYDPYNSSVLLCNIINTHIKNVRKATDLYNDLAIVAENSMVALADSLRTLRLMAQQNVNDQRNKCIRFDQEMYDPVIKQNQEI